MGPDWVIGLDYWLSLIIKALIIGEMKFTIHLSHLQNDKSQEVKVLWLINFVWYCMHQSIMC